MLGVLVAIPSPAPPGAQGAAQPSAGVAPSSLLAGLSLGLRAVLVLQKQGVSRVVLAIRSGDGELVEQIRADGRVKVEIEAVELAAGASLGRALRSAVDEPFLLCTTDLVLDPRLLRTLGQDLELTGLGRAAARGGVALEPLPPLRGKPGLLDALARLEDEPLPAGGGAEPGASAPEPGCLRPATLHAFTRLIEQRELELCDVGDAWAADARSAAGRARAVHHLFEACRKPVDGIVARLLNRHVSLFLSKRLVGAPVSPNAMTVMTFLVGVGGAAVAMRGGYWPTLCGAALMQCNSILDGVDGELARVRHQQSKLGQWLDTIGDDASNLVFYAALAWGARSLPRAATAMSVAGWVVTAATLLTAVLYYSELLGTGSGDLYALEWSFEQRPAPGWRDRLLRAFHAILKQDFFIFLFLVLALCGVLSYSLPLFALGGVITVIAATARRIARLWRRRAAQRSSR